jgi:hypothetical protein
MPAHSFLRASGRGFFSVSLALLVSLGVLAQDRTTPTQTKVPPKTGTSSPSVYASQEFSPKGNHQAETNPGRTPHGSGNGAAIAAGVGAAAAAVIAGEIFAHHPTPEKLGNKGPQVPKEFDMNGFVMKGLVQGNWPIALDFMIDSPGFAQVDITAGKKHFLVRMHNDPNRRGIAKIHLPKYFGTKPQIATYNIRSMPVAGSNDRAPRLRVYGFGAGEKAVGSVAIYQLTFQPATIHPKAQEVADYGFHAHSAFDSVKAGFIFTTLHNDGSVLVQKDQEQELSPVPEGERAKGTWKGDPSKAGEHMLQIRAWRGLQSGGDWVVAWSPEIVDVVK